MNKPVHIKKVMALLLILFLVFITSCTAEEEGDPAGVTITVYSSSTKEDWLNGAAEAFNQSGFRTNSGKLITVEVFHVNSGGSLRSIIAGDIQPTVWSPGELSWVNSANDEWQALTGEPLISENCPATVFEPTGFAMWRPMAEALGWPGKPVLWQDIIDLAADPGGWARYDHPEWGQLKLGLTNPENSNSGRLILTGLAYAALDMTGGLTPELVRTAPVAEAFRQIGRRTAETGRQSAVLLEKMVIGGPERLHAINTNEAETLKSNARYGKLLPYPLVFIIPADGTSWGEHPYCILDTDWVSGEQHEAARLFAAYLLEPAQQMMAVERGLRPANRSVELAAPISVDNGANPGATPLTVPALESPTAAVAKAIADLFALVN